MDHRLLQREFVQGNGLLGIFVKKSIGRIPIPPDHIKVEVFVGVIQHVMVGVFRDGGDVAHGERVSLITHYQFGGAFDADEELLINLGMGQRLRVWPHDTPTATNGRWITVPRQETGTVQIIFMNQFVPRHGAKYLKVSHGDSLSPEHPGSLFDRRSLLLNNAVELRDKLKKIGEVSKQEIRNQQLSLT